jgi:hypothetical protein
MVALEEMLDESADDYENVVKFITPFQSVIFGPNSEFPRDAVEFENAFNCMEYDDMRVR